MGDMSELIMRAKNEVAAIENEIAHRQMETDSFSDKFWEGIGIPKIPSPKKEAKRSSLQDLAPPASLTGVEASEGLLPAEEAMANGAAVKWPNFSDVSWRPKMEQQIEAAKRKIQKRVDEWYWAVPPAPPTPESGPGIAKLPPKPAADFTGWADDYDLLPDAE